MIEQEAATISRAFARFRKQQTELGGGVTSADKTELRIRLDRLRNQLDRLLLLSMVWTLTPTAHLKTGV